MVDSHVSTSTDAIRILSTAIFADDGETAAEILVLNTMYDGVEEAARLLGVQLSTSAPAGASAVDLRALAAELFGRPSLEAPSRHRFLDELVFTRQVAIEQSPIEKWSLAELWTRFSLGASGMGIGYVTASSVPVMIICGTFGTLLMRPLAAVV